MGEQLDDKVVFSVLLVEDDSDFLQRLWMLFTDHFRKEFKLEPKEKDRIKVVPVSTGREAVKAMALARDNKQKFDLVCSDLNLPDANIPRGELIDGWGVMKTAYDYDVAKFFMIVSSVSPEATPEKFDALNNIINIGQPIQDRVELISYYNSVYQEMGQYFPSKSTFVKKELSKEATLEKIKLRLEGLYSKGNLTGGEISEKEPATNDFTISNVDIIGDDKTFIEALRWSENAAKYDVPILLLGETGVGKEVFAKHIHIKSPRKGKPFFAFNCAALPEETVESELFGHEKGSFTGATSVRKGYFELAKDGTLFLDEVGELAPQLQAKLLRVLQEGKFMRLGGEKELTTKARVIAATNVDLCEAMEMKRFREDLYFRLASGVINIPPLRERMADLPLLINEFVKKKNVELGTSFELSFEIQEIMSNHSWPGNVRELEKMIERLFVFSPPDKKEVGLEASIHMFPTWGSRITASVFDRDKKMSAIGQEHSVTSDVVPSGNLNQFGQKLYGDKYDTERLIADALEMSFSRWTDEGVADILFSVDVNRKEIFETDCEKMGNDGKTTKEKFLKEKARLLDSEKKNLINRKKAQKVAMAISKTDFAEVKVRWPALMADYSSNRNNKSFAKAIEILKPLLNELYGN